MMVHSSNGSKQLVDLSAMLSSMDSIKEKVETMESILVKQGLVAEPYDLSAMFADLESMSAKFDEMYDSLTFKDTNG